jgi:hypothetical protein
MKAIVFTETFCAKRVVRRKGALKLFSSDTSFSRDWWEETSYQSDQDTGSERSGIQDKAGQNMHITFETCELSQTAVKHLPMMSHFTQCGWWKYRVWCIRTYSSPIQHIFTSRKHLPTMVVLQLDDGVNLSVPISLCKLSDCLLVHFLQYLYLIFARMRLIFRPTLHSSISMSNMRLLALMRILKYVNICLILLRLSWHLRCNVVCVARRFLQDMCCYRKMILHWM